MCFRQKQLRREEKNIYFYKKQFINGVESIAYMRKFDNL